MSEEITLEDIRAYATPEEYAEFLSASSAIGSNMVFFPNRGPQTLAMESEADVIGYGGAAGGGKSYLVTGLAATRHQRSAIIRPQKNQTNKFVEELSKMLGSREGYNSQASTFKFEAEGAPRLVKFFGLDNPGDEEKQQGEDFDGKFYDEVTQMREEDVRYTLTWNRTDDPAQRVRAVLAFNPPKTAEGRWVIRFFAPWLDKRHLNPAKEGELRWFATIGDNQDYEVKGPQKFIIKRKEDGSLVPWYSFTEADHRPEEIISPKSRTFIKARVTDNPYYMASGYMSQLQALPEPYRSQMLDGDFDAGVEDDAHQLIPTEWVYAANERWRKIKAAMDGGAVLLSPMDSIGVDVARGGNMGSQLGAVGHDEAIISKRHGTFFEELVAHKGVAIDDGAKSAALVIAERRNDAPVHVDVVGVGTSTYDFLASQNIHVLPVNGAAKAFGQAGNLRFANLRAELHWRLREALDPLHPNPIALPPDEKLAVDLTAVRWFLGATGIQMELKDKIKQRIGRSPDRGDAVVLANIDTPKREMNVGGYLGVSALLSRGGMSYEEQRRRELED